MSSFFTEQQDIARSEIKTGIGFGLNQNAVLTRISRSETVQADGTPSNSLQVEFKFVGEDGKFLTTKDGSKDSMKRTYLSIPSHFTRKQTDGGGDVDDVHDEFFIEKSKEILASVTSLVKLVLPDTYKNMLRFEADNVRAYFEEIIRRVESPTFQKRLQIGIYHLYGIPCDLFLEYPFEAGPDKLDSEGNKYLRVPSKSTHGEWVCARQPGKYKVDENQPVDTKLNVKPLVYVNEQNAVHPISRLAWFMSSDFSKRSTLNTPQAGGQTFNNGKGRPSAQEEALAEDW